MNLEQKTKITLTRQALEVVQTISKIAEQLGDPVYLVGGAVRDILLERTSNDLDFVTIGSGIRLGQMVCSQFGGSLKMHERFGTAVWTPPAEMFEHTIDLITARKEVYEQPAALPNVTPSAMEDDLFRRDFTINALAMRIDGNQRGELLDIYQGLDALQNREIRILHPESFRDDPTRIFRAARYAARLGFALSEATLTALKQSAHHIQALSPDRIRHELEKILAEPHPAPMLDLLQDWGVFNAFSSEIVWQDRQRLSLTHLEANLAGEPGLSAKGETDLYDLRLGAWLSSLANQASALKAAGELNLSADLSKTVARVYDLVSSPIQPQPSFVEKQLRGTSSMLLVLLQSNLSASKQLKQLIPTYYTQWRHVKTVTTGDTLREMGLPPGPIYQTILNQLKADKLDGVFDTPKAEQTRLQELIQQLPESKKGASQ